MFSQAWDAAHGGMGQCETWGVISCLILMRLGWDKGNGVAESGTRHGRCSERRKPRRPRAKHVGQAGERISLISNQTYGRRERPVAYVSRSVPVGLVLDKVLGTQGGSERYWIVTVPVNLVWKHRRRMNRGVGHSTCLVVTGNGGPKEAWPQVGDGGCVLSRVGN